MSTFSIYGVLVYVVVLFIISAFFVKKALNSFEEYSLCGRSLSATYIMFTYLGTWIGGGTIIGLASSSYLSGVGQYWILAIPYVTGYAFAFLFISRIRKINLHSIGDMLALRYPDHGEIIRIPVAVGLIIRNVTMIGMQFSALSFLMTYAFGIDRNLAILFTFLVITAYTVLGGLWGVVVTDIFQGFLQTFGLIVLLVLSIKLSGGMNEIYEFYKEIDKESFLNLLGAENWFQVLTLYFFTFGVFFLMGDQSDWDRIYASKSDKTAFWGYLVPLTITLILLLIPAYLGAFQRVLLPEVDSDYAVYYFIMELLTPQMATVILIGIFAAIMSSADSFMLATGVIFANDIVKKFLNQDANDKEMIFWTRFFVVISGAIGLAFAINISDIIFLWITGIGIAASTILPAYLCAWFSRRTNTKGVIAGVGVGMFYCMLWLMGYIVFSIDKIFIGMIMNLSITLFVSILSDKPAFDTVMTTYYWSSKFKTVSNIPK